MPTHRTSTAGTFCNKTAKRYNTNYQRAITTARQGDFGENRAENADSLQTCKLFCPRRAAGDVFDRDAELLPAVRAMRADPLIVESSPAADDTSVRFRHVVRASLHLNRKSKITNS